jgi:FlaG/FlaF family flagellin (archaellin)
MTERDLSGYVEIQGIAPLSSVVSVNSQAADRQGEYYRKELSVSTTSAAAYTDVTVSGTGLTSSAGKVFTPKDPDILTYDASGMKRGHFVMF